MVVPESERQVQAMAVLVMVLVVMTLGQGVQGRAARVQDTGSGCKVWLVQSTPTDMPELPQVPGVLSTGDVLRWLAGNATEKGLDVTAQYWELQAEPHNPSSGDYGFSDQEMERLGAPVGEAVYASLLAAADRGVPIR